MANNVTDALSDFTANMAGQAQMGFGGYQDKPLPTGYSKDGWYAHYSHSWLARIAVDGVPEDCFKKGYQWVAEAEQITRIEDVERIHKIKKKKRQALSAARLDGVAYLYINTGEAPGEELELDRVGRDELAFVHVLRSRELQAGETDNDPMSRNYGNPEYYEMKTNNGQVRIHHSRIIRFVGAEDPITGNPIGVLSYMIQPIIAAETARDNVVALTTEANIDIISVCGLMDEVSTPDGAAKMAKRYGLLRAGKATNKIAVLDKDGEEWSQRQVSFATLPDVIESMRREAAAAVGRPYALIWGRNSALGANGDMELINYYDDISTIQRNEIQPTCEVLDEVVIRSALGSRPPEIYLEWLSLWETTDKEKADNAKVWADAAKVAVDSGIIPAEEMTDALVNAWTEGGAFPGLEQSMEEWKNAGGWEAEEPEESNVIRPNSEVTTDE